MSDHDITVITWNLFHGQDGARLGPTLRSTLTGSVLDDGTHVHANRKWVAPMADVIRDLAPTFAALQEVPPQAVRAIAERTGMRQVHALMRPVIGPLRLRGWLADRNPDLWRTHEGTANVVLYPPDWERVDSWTFRHNPPAVAVRHGHRLRLSVRQRLHWLAEPRRLVAGRFRAPDGRTLTVASLHCHDADDPAVIALEIDRILGELRRRVPAGEPIIVAGDFNARGSAHPALAAMTDAGFHAPSAAQLGIDHIFHRDLMCVVAPRVLPRSVRERAIDWRGRARLLTLSDHDVVSATYRW